MSHMQPGKGDRAAGEPGSGEAWSQLDSAAEDAAWAAVQELFAFPRWYWLDGESTIREPSPCLTLDLEPLFESRVAYAGGRAAVNGLALYAWTTILPPGERLLALDWQHLCYRWQPHEHAVLGAEWLIEPFPEGDFHVFLTEDFAAGTFGDPLRYTLCVFGADLLRTLGPALSSWLPTRWIRR
jgi:hypothetical protein